MQPQKLRSIEARSHDWPAFLVNSNRTEPLIEETPAPAADFQSRIKLATGELSASLSARYLDAKDRLNSLGQQSRDLPGIWQRHTMREQTSRIALIAVVAPLLLLATPGRAPPTDTPAPRPVHVSLPTPPVFDQEVRLAFAQGLRDRLLSNAIALSLKGPVPLDTDGGRSEAPPIVSQPPTVADADAPVPPRVILDDRKWSLPFGSQRYAPADFPKTPGGSFRAEIAMSDLMDVRQTVAQNDVPVVTPAPTAKEIQAPRRKKVVAQKKRRPAPVNQMTASAAAQPTITQQEPNLPPPPILFFLGAPPPPQSQQP
ncbi:hypothetical protein [Hyphomicrobium sp.]|uniref:hypothetical protein n=1 Tax=Hyphomicrobium sp. TaxID=82 RepID=UPI0035660250